MPMCTHTARATVPTGLTGFSHMCLPADSLSPILKHHSCKMPLTTPLFCCIVLARSCVCLILLTVNFLTKGSLNGSGPDASIVLELLPVMPTIAREVLPQITSMLISRISARTVRELYA